MPVRVEVSDYCWDDLNGYARSGNIRLFLNKLIRIEEHGAMAGIRLGGNLAGLYKVVVGDRQWRIIFEMNEEGTVAKILVIGNRSDDECYRIAARRVEESRSGNDSTMSLAAAIAQLPQLQKKPR